MACCLTTSEFVSRCAGCKLGDMWSDHGCSGIREYIDRSLVDAADWTLEGGGVSGPETTTSSWIVVGGALEITSRGVFDVAAMLFSKTRSCDGRAGNRFYSTPC